MIGEVRAADHRRQTPYKPNQQDEPQHPAQA